ncbi:unnamed protein product [Oikopleura dioica]|uniref:Uncharacterized protein n=1 Tax=Oikopleura dioica TaxID=34765 RepID=E4XNX8_OIKDI|nr:unnamed protein product [Oikopleura dioica]
MRGVRSASSRNSWDSSTAQCGTMTLDPDFDKPIEDQDLYQEPKSPLFHPLDDIQKVQAEINIIEKEDYDHASEYSYPEQNPFHESAIILTEEPDLTVPEIAGNQTSTPPIVKKDDCNHEALVDSPTSSKSVQLERVNPHPENIEMKKESFEDIGAAEIIKDSLSFDDDDENSEIARIMNRPASNQMNADQRSSVATGLSSRRTSFLSKEIEALSNFSKLGVPMKLKNSFKKLGGLFRNKKKKEIVIDEGELIAAVEKHDASDVESGLAYQTPPEGVHPDEVLAPGVPDEFLDDFAVKHNIEGEEEDEEFQIPDERERVLDEILSNSHAASEASESQTTKKMNQ